MSDLDPRIEDRREVDVPPLDLRRLLDPTPMTNSVLPQQFLAPATYDARDLPTPTAARDKMEARAGGADLDRAAAIARIMQLLSPLREAHDPIEPLRK